jgi:hypothetical protein
MADFRLCLTCLSCSQASFYHYALQLISVQSELTFARFRYSLGSDRPSQTTHLPLFPKGLENRQSPGGISRMLSLGDQAPTYPTHTLWIFNSKLQ